jgi:prephenate dehydratase
MRIAIQGEPGSYHQVAAEQFFSSDIDLVFCHDFAATFQAVVDDHADALVVGIENTTYGSITPVYDLIEAHDFPIVGEVTLPIAHRLIGAPDAQVDDIRYVHSQVMALAQCTDFLDSRPDIERVEFYDTAAAVKHIVSQGDPHHAAIASVRAAEIYGGQILIDNISNHDNNITRFLVLQPNGQVPADANKSSLILTTDHQPGALYASLGALARRNINIVKIQSRPIQGMAWKYQFYFVLETAGAPLHDATAEIAQLGYAARILGEYCAATTS